jgi:hypothetical protein
MWNVPMTHVLNKQIFFHTMVVSSPFLEDYFAYFTMEQNEKYVLIQGVPIEVSTQTITS